MQFLKNLDGLAESAKHSAVVSLNASRDSYAFLESTRDGSQPDLMRRAVSEYMLKKGCTLEDAYMKVGARVAYLKELASGDLTFHGPRVELRKEAESAKRCLSHLQSAKAGQ